MMKKSLIFFGTFLFLFGWVRYFFSSGGIRNLLFGVGPDGFGYWFEESGILIPVSGQFQDAVYANAHNEFITCMVNLGIPGVILYIAFFVNTLIRFLKAKGHPWRMTGILLIAAYTVNQFFSFQQLVATPLFIFLIALE